MREASREEYLALYTEEVLDRFVRLRDAGFQPEVVPNVITKEYAEYAFHLQAVAEVLRKRVGLDPAQYRDGIVVLPAGAPWPDPAQFLEEAEGRMGIRE